MNETTAWTEIGGTRGPARKGFDAADDAIAAATDRAGFSGLSATQERAIGAAVGGRDTVVVSSTGSGKSAIYQIAGAATDGPTVVVSPLLALVEDQIASLAATSLPSAVAIDGSTTPTSRQEHLGRLRSGEAGYLFVTPETLNDEDLLAELRACDVALLVVDEAHCVVTWGQGYRPDYLLIGDLRRAMGSPTCIALTASADPRIRADLGRLLDLDGHLEVVLPLHRHEITLSLDASPDHATAQERLIEHVSGLDGKTLVYAPTRRLCDEIAGELGTAGRPAEAFHGGCSTTAKSAVLGWFRHSPDGVVVATTAFGMGIDIPDIRHVVHLDLPPTLIEYYQEIGRAARDGQPASARCFVGMAKNSRRRFTGGVRPTTVDDCRRVLAAVASGSSSRKQLSEELEISTGRISRAATVLEMAGALRSDGGLRAIDATVPAATVEAICAEREAFHRAQIQAVDAYRSTTTCRWQLLTSTLGEVSTPCGGCDRCLETDSTSEHGSKVGLRVEHQVFGCGVVTQTTTAGVIVSFESVGPKQIDLDHAVEAGLLELNPRRGARRR